MILWFVYLVVNNCHCWNLFSSPAADISVSQVSLLCKFGNLFSIDMVFILLVVQKSGKTHQLRVGSVSHYLNKVLYIQTVVYIFPNYQQYGIDIVAMKPRKHRHRTPFKRWERWELIQGEVFFPKLDRWCPWVLIDSKDKQKSQSFLTFLGGGQNYKW